MLTTNDARIDTRLRQLRQHCMSVPDTQRHGSAEVIFESYPEVGYNYRMTDMQAAIGLVQLGKLPAFLERRRELAARYHQLLGDAGMVEPPFEPDWARSNWQSYCVRLPRHARQKVVMQSMLDAGVSTRRAVMCAHRELAYPRDSWRCTRRLEGGCGCAAQSCEALRESEAAQDIGVILPLYPQMTDAEQLTVVDRLHEAVAEESRVTERRPAADRTAALDAVATV